MAPLKKQQFVGASRYAILQETEKSWQMLNRPAFKNVMFLRKYQEKLFCVETRF
jgi:hypothetical protein